jgi:DNA-binding phage protein
MELTRDFHQTVVKRIRKEPDFAAEMLRGASEAFLQGEAEVGNSLLRDYVNGTVGFKRLASEAGFGEKSLMRMLSATGNPRSRNLFKIIATLQRLSNRHLSVAAE